MTDQSKQSQLDAIERLAVKAKIHDIGSEEWFKDAEALKRAIGIDMFAPGGLYYEMRREWKQLHSFAQDILSRWPEGDIDGSDLQEIALKHGLLKPTMMDKPCGEICACAEFYSEDEWPVECFRKTKVILDG